MKDLKARSNLRAVSASPGNVAVLLPRLKLGSLGDFADRDFPDRVEGCGVNGTSLSSFFEPS